MDKYEEKIINNILKDKKEGDILSKEELQYLENITIIQPDGYGKSDDSVIFRYNDESEEIFLEGDKLKEGRLKITYIL